MGYHGDLTWSWRKSMSFGIWELVIVLLIVALLFGTRKLRSIGNDLGSALKGFRSALRDDDSDSTGQSDKAPPDGQVIEGQVNESGNDSPDKS